MQAKINRTLVATLVAIVSTGAALAGTKVASLAPPPAPRATTIVPKQVLVRPDAPAVNPDRSLTQVEQRGIEDTVRGQLRALVARNATQAFAGLAPSTQHYFGKPDKFFDTIARSLPPVLEAKHFAFLGVEQDNSGAYQQVLITDGDGRDWIAKFQVERQPAGDWRVKGCVVEVAPGQQA
jgi:Domain of unknown function (DUF4864)